MDTTRKNFKILFEGHAIKRIFLLGDPVSQAVKAVRLNFEISEETELKINFGEREVNPSNSFEEEGILGGELVTSRVNPIISEKPKMIFISVEDEDPLDWATVYSNQVKQVKNEFCQANNIAPDSYVFTVDGKFIDENLSLKDVPQVEQIIFVLQKIDQKHEEKSQLDSITTFNFKVKNQSKIRDITLKLNPCLTINSLKQRLQDETSIKVPNQIWSLKEDEEDLNDDVILLEVLKNDTSQIIWIKDRTELNLKEKVYKFVYNNGNPIRRRISSGEKIKNVNEIIKKFLKIPKDVEIYLQYDNITLESSRTLDEVIIDSKNDIIVLTAADIANSVIISFTYDGGSEISKMPCLLTQLGKEIKESAIKMLSLKNIQLYSLTLDDNIIDDHIPLKDVKAFDQNSVFDVQPNIIAIFVFEEDSKKREDKITIPPKGKVLDLKTFLFKEGKVKSTKFGLFMWKPLTEENQKSNEEGALLLNSELIMEDETNIADYFPNSTPEELPKVIIREDILDVIQRKSISIILPNETKEIALNKDMRTVENLKKYLEKMMQVDSTSQVLILVKNDNWERKLLDDSEIISNLVDEDLRILLKRSKKYDLVDNIVAGVMSFEGLAGCLIKDQKKMLELHTKFPADQQIWILGKIDAPKILQDDDKVEDYDLQSMSNNPVQVFRKIELNVCFGEKSICIKDIPTYEKIWRQKEKISPEINILPEEQMWHYNEQELDDKKMIEECFLLDAEKGYEFSKTYAIDLTVQNDLEFFGFTEKSEINIGLFRDFFMESSQEFDSIINGASFEDKNASLQFRNKILGLFFGTLKKHSLWEDLIKKIKKHAFDLKGVNLWKNKEKLKANQSKFNTQFLLYYFLNCDSYELNIEVLKVMKMHYPLPLAISFLVKQI